MKHEYMKINILLESLPSGLIFRESVKISHPQNWRVYYRMLNELDEEGMVASGTRNKKENGIKYRFTYFGLTIAGLYRLNQVITSPNADVIFNAINKPIDEYWFLSVIPDVIASLFPDGDVPQNTPGFYNRSLQFIITSREQAGQIPNIRWCRCSLQGPAAVQMLWCPQSGHRRSRSSGTHNQAQNLRPDTAAGCP